MSNQTPQDALDTRVRFVLDTRHTVPVGQSHTDTYAPRIVKLINSEVREVLDRLEKNIPSPPFVSFERCRTTEDYNVRQAERVVAKAAISAIKAERQRYE